MLVSVNRSIPVYQTFKSKSRVGGCLPGCLPSDKSFAVGVVPYPAH